MVMLPCTRSISVIVAEPVIVRVADVDVVVNFTLLLVPAATVSVCDTPPMLTVTVPAAMPLSEKVYFSPLLMPREMVCTSRPLCILQATPVALATALTTVHPV